MAAIRLMKPGSVHRLMRSGRGCPLASEDVARTFIQDAAQFSAVLLPLASRSTILQIAAICGASLVRKSLPV